MRVGQDAIVTQDSRSETHFSRARIYKLLRYPSAKDVRWVTTSPTFLTGKLLGPYALEPFVVELFSVRFLRISTRRFHPAERPVAWPLPPHASSVVRTRLRKDKPSPRGRDYAKTSLRLLSHVRFAAERSSRLHPLRTTRPSIKDCSQEGFSESPRFWLLESKDAGHAYINPTANESDRIAVLLVECFHTNGTHETDYSAKPPSRYRVYPSCSPIRATRGNVIILCCNTSDHIPPSDKHVFMHPALPNLIAMGS